MATKAKRGLSQERSRAFTLTELLVVVGLVALLVSLLMPALGQARAAARTTGCLSNLRQMGLAWTMYLSENRGHLPELITHTPATPDVAWNAYWLGILEHYNVRGELLLCPTARDAIPFKQVNSGFGNAQYAWTGKFAASGNVVKFNAQQYREGSYGYNRYLTAGGGFGRDGKADRINAVRQLSEVPVLLDAVYIDFAPVNGLESFPASTPPNLKGEKFPLAPPDPWRFLVARHKRGVNAAMADGSARWVPLEETYQLTWKHDWVKYRLRLPPG